MIRVSSEPIKLKDVLEGNYYTVPLYQREFSWEIEEVSDLFHDIFDASEEHFFGTILLAQESDGTNRYEIIDGQQRLMTLLLLLSAIRTILIEESKKSNKPDEIYNKGLEQLLFSIPTTFAPIATNTSFEPRFKANKRDHNLFCTVIKGGEPQPTKSLKSHLKIAAAYNYLYDNINSMKIKEGISAIHKFLDKIILKSKFIKMTTENNADKVLLFKALNARGLELTKADLVKNEICRHRKNLEIEEAIELWDDIRVTIEHAGANIDNFLYHYINSLERANDIRKKIAENRSSQQSDKIYYPPIPEKYLFDAYEYELKNSTDTRIFLNEIKEASGHYSSFAKPPKDAYHLLALKELNASRCYPLLLHAKRILSEKDFKKLCLAIEILTFRHSTIIQRDAKELETFYYQLIELLKTNQSLHLLLDNIKKHASVTNDGLFKQAFLTASPKISVSKFILHKIISSMEESVDIKQDIHLEHIMPQTPSGEWKKLAETEENQEKYKEYLNRLGNLTIILDRWNRTMSNKDYVEKIPLYDKSRITITKEIPTKWKTWNYKTIDERQEFLYEYASKIWTADKIK
ncbi:MAG: DUF262 domain-containing protein [Candidatus Latescibacteria bacterium]|nr:DUF262 domain-containing protein [Candidatus Latescibacterota bacterium]